ncbi:MAG: hypothetical protein ACD_60C00093G0003 [uncultured bacterium]|nr:MAG: hypothetical protein ACD_60C00093G0003 [uncultured bacterium]
MTQLQISIHQINFNLPSGAKLFHDLTLSLTKRKIGLVGRNGIGKSTLLKLILGEFLPQAGSIRVQGKLGYVPQHFSIFPESTIKSFLMDEWQDESRLRKTLMIFGLDAIPDHRQLKNLSGGEMTRLLLVKTLLSDADFLLLDEPTNHLDQSARQALYRAIQEWRGGLIVVSHDRTLLNFMEEIVELNSLGVTSYGGNYDDYRKQKDIENAARENQLQDAKKLMQKTKQTIQSSREKHEQKKSYGRELRRSGSIDKLTANSKKGRSERTQSKLLIKEERLMDHAEEKLQSAKEGVEILDEIHVDLAKTYVPNGKIMVEIQDLSFSYQDAKEILIQDFDLKIRGHERIALAGDNGSGKTTLIKLLLSILQPTQGKIYLGTSRVSYLDQGAILLNPDLSVIENFLVLNPNAKENDAYRCLAEFLFKNKAAHKIVKTLSGGEKLRALLASVLMANQPPELLILDEPTNHLDLNSVRSIESILKNYQGAMIVISHDQCFLENIKINRVIEAPLNKSRNVERQRQAQAPAPKP